MNSEMTRCDVLFSQVKPGGEFMNLVTAAYPLSKSVSYESPLAVSSHVPIAVALCQSQCFIFGIVPLHGLKTSQTPKNAKCIVFV